MDNNFWQGFEKQAALMTQLGRASGWLKNMGRVGAAKAKASVQNLGQQFSAGKKQVTDITNRRVQKAGGTFDPTAAMSNKTTPEGVTSFWGRRSPVTKGVVGGAVLGAGGVMGAQHLMNRQQNAQPTQYQ